MVTDAEKTRTYYCYHLTGFWIFPPAHLETAICTFCMCVCVHVSSSSEHTSEMSHESFSKSLIFYGTDWYRNSCSSLKVALSILVYRDRHLRESQVSVVVRSLSQVLLPQLLLRNRTRSTWFVLGVLLLPCWKVSILSSSSLNELRACLSQNDL